MNRSSCFFFFFSNTVICVMITLTNVKSIASVHVLITSAIKRARLSSDDLLCQTCMFAC